MYGYIPENNYDGVDGAKSKLFSSGKNEFLHGTQRISKVRNEFYRCVGSTLYELLSTHSAIINILYLCMYA